MKFLTCNAISTWITSTYFKSALGPKYTEPLQGCIDDCQFIAALSAVAWTSAASRATITYPPTFDGVVYDVAKSYPADDSSKAIYARSSTKYIWPMVYEKAYAKKCGAQQLPGDNDPDHIDISILKSGGNAVTAIKEITRWNPKEFLLANMNTITRETDPKYKDSLFNPSNIPRDAGGKTLYPSAAWTSDPGQIKGIYPDHAYTLLGIYFCQDTKSYVVLRNPSEYHAGVCEEPDADVCTSGTWNGINFSTTDDNIFALEINKFKQYFYAYGYAK